MLLYQIEEEKDGNMVSVRGRHWTDRFEEKEKKIAHPMLLDVCSTYSMTYAGNEIGWKDDTVPSCDKERRRARGGGVGEDISRGCGLGDTFVLFLCLLVS